VHTDFDTVVRVFKDYPTNSSDAPLTVTLEPPRWGYKQSDRCASLNIELEEEGGWWIMVEGVGSQEGNFELVVLCSDAPTAHPTALPTPLPTALPTQLPTPEPTMDGTRDPTPAPSISPAPTPFPTAVPTSTPTHSACDFTPIFCGQTLDGTTSNHRDVGGGPGKEKNYVISFDEPTRIFVTTCFAATKISVTMWLYDGCPFTGGHNLTRNDEGHYCGIMFYDHHTIDDLWVLVESSDASETGEFRVRVTCTDVPTPAPSMPPTPVPSPVPTPSWCAHNGILTCNSTVTGDNTAFGSYVGGAGGDMNFVLTVDKATRVTAITCGAGTNSTRVSGSLPAALSTRHSDLQPKTSRTSRSRRRHTVPARTATP
jgi:hypothetical protein